jgi:hypothetical protein
LRVRLVGMVPPPDPYKQTWAVRDIEKELIEDARKRPLPDNWPVDCDLTLDDLSGSEWDLQSECECDGCDYSGTVKDLLIDKKEAAD